MTYLYPNPGTPPCRRSILPLASPLPLPPSPFPPSPSRMVSKKVVFAQFGTFQEESPLAGQKEHTFFHTFVGNLKGTSDWALGPGHGSSATVRPSPRLTTAEATSSSPAWVCLKIRGPPKMGGVSLIVFYPLASPPPPRCLTPPPQKKKKKKFPLASREKGRTSSRAPSKERQTRLAAAQRPQQRAVCRQHALRVQGRHEARRRPGRQRPEPKGMSWHGSLSPRCAYDGSGK